MSEVTVTMYQVPLSRCTPEVAAWLKGLGAIGVLIKTINGEIVEAEPIMTKEEAVFEVAIP